MAADDRHESDPSSLDAQIDREMGWDKIAGRAKPRRPSFVWKIPGLILYGIWRFIYAIVWLFLFVCFFPVFTPLRVLRRNPRNGVEREAPRPFLSRLVEGIVVRSLVFSILIVGYFWGLVYLTTRPAPVLAVESPTGQGLFYRVVHFQSADGKSLHGWYIPPITVDDVVQNQSQTLTERWPGVVLAHGLGYSHDQYIAMAARMNRLGFGVLLVDTRGQGQSEESPVTFGLQEREDILAAVGFMRAQPTTDRARICVIGQGTSGVAAIRAAAVDPSIAGVVADTVDPNFGARLETFTPGSKLVGHVVGTLYRAAFEATNGGKFSDLALASTVAGNTRTPTLYVARAEDPGSVNDALGLAERTSAKHDFLLAQPAGANGALQPTDEREEAKFLCESVNWTPPVLRRQQTVRDLLEHQVR